MRKYFRYVFVLIALFAFIFIPNNDVSADEIDEPFDIVYFYTPECRTCELVTPHVEALIEEGFSVGMYNVNYRENNRLMVAYIIAYELGAKANYPLLFAGDTSFEGISIRSAILDGHVQTAASEASLREPIFAPFELGGIAGFFGLVFAGLLDGVNPCAIAMLLFFISLLGTSSNKKRLIGISITFIGALFITYFLLGTVLYGLLTLINLAVVGVFLSWFIILLCSFLFVFNLYDYIVTKREKYEKVKLQLPKFIQRFNKNYMKKFTTFLQEGSGISVYLLTFGIGFLISLTEFLCTGQIYLPIIISLFYYSSTFLLAAFYLIIYNLMFVLPLIIIAVVAIKTESVASVSNKVRENMHRIKLANALLFLGIVLFYIFYVL